MINLCQNLKYSSAGRKRAVNEADTQLMHIQVNVNNYTEVSHVKIML